MPRGLKKGLRIGRALKSAARLPIRVSGGIGSGRHRFSPVPGENPVVLLRLQVLGCKDLLAKDRNGFSDPFVVVALLNTRFHTPVSKKTISPTYDAKDATFDFPIYLSLADKLGVLELVIWDKDMLTKDYLGEVALPLKDWFKDGNAYAFDDENNKPYTVNILSTRSSTPSTGTLQVKIGFVTAPNAISRMEFDEVFSELVKRSRPSLVSAPPTEGIGTIRSHLHGPAFQDDGGISSDEGEGNSEDEDDEVRTEGRPSFRPPLRQRTPIQSAFPELSEQTQTLSASQPKPPPSRLDIPMTPSTPTPGALTKTPVPMKSSVPSFMPKIFPRRQVSTSSSEATPSVIVKAPDADSPTTFSPRTPTPTFPPRTASLSPEPSAAKRRHFKKKLPSKSPDYNFSAVNDIVGIVMLEIQNATDLPRLKNMTRTGWDMDPFVVTSFGKKVFRTRVIRHSRNPVWDEKLLFHVRRYETNFKMQLTVLDWDKLSSNDYVGEASLDISELIADAPPRNPETGLYAEGKGADHAMKEFVLPLTTTTKEMPWESKHNPILTFRAKYQPYDAVRQQFWRQYLKQYDTDDFGVISHLELTSMLDSLGSTLSQTTIDSFFTRHDKKPHDDNLSYDQAIQCLETELCRPEHEKRRIDSEGSELGTTSGTPNIMTESESRFMKLSLGDLDFSGPDLRFDDRESSPIRKSSMPPSYTTEPSVMPSTDDITRDDMRKSEGESGQQLNAASSGHTTREMSYSSSDAEAEDSSGSSGSETFERVINVKNCPLCHRPRLNSKAEVDIVTHLAVCASQDWDKVDRIVVGNFVTASQAQRKWYTKIITKVSSGDYKLGANSANIIVQNRITGQLEEEKMQVYVRLGIRLLYKGAKSRMEGARARKLLKSLSIKQGIKFDSPESTRDILPFIEFHQLNIEENLDPIDSFKTFNEFFYRKLKPSARPVESPEDPNRLVSAADCRLMTFESVHEATRLWIKGRDFTVARLLGDAYRGQADKYIGGALAIFRLAPQDYHRFHSPVDGVIGPMTYISGEYYTVNPQAIRTSLDVYGENVRKIVPIDSPQFGRVMAVCVGAMMVGSIKTTLNEGEQVKRGQEFGYFAFGGSTIVILFEKGTVEWDEDVLINGRASLETLVHVGMGIGRRRHPGPAPSPLSKASILPSQ